MPATRVLVSEDPYIAMAGLCMSGLRNSRVVFSNYDNDDWPVPLRNSRR
jgi:hypothetical protein